jgi:hypothetical protein
MKHAKINNLTLQEILVKKEQKRKIFHIKKV